MVPGDRRQAQTAPGLLGLRGQEHQALDWAPKRFQPRLAATDTFPELLPRDAGSDVAIEDLHIGFPELMQFGMINSLSQIKSSRGAVAPEPKPAKKRRVTRELERVRKNSIVQPYRTKTLDLMGNAMDLADESCVLYPLYLATDSIWKKPLVFPHDKEFKKPKRDMWFECKFDTTSSSASFNAHVREQMTRLGESEQIDDEDPCSD